jgi:hypothetical protein
MTAPAAVAAGPAESAEPALGSAQQMAEDKELTFTGTPGPGYSEGGDVYDPMAPPRVSELGVIT